MQIKLKLPPIVGVPFASICHFGPSSLIGCPNLCLTLKYLINFGPTKKLIKIEVIKARLV